ncbi:MAG TPA: alcohol dehydrogenase catalytic domain-containing protein [Propionibacteriaceae bacterium]|jgi:L-iditol 2-dehydrogenase
MPAETGRQVDTVTSLVKVRHGDDSIELVERAWLSPGAGEVAIEVRAVGVCGTDLHIAADEYPNDPPVVLGHEVYGIVADLGAGVDESWSRQRVVCETYFATCESCQWCRDGRRNLCPWRRSIGSWRDGGFSARMILPARNLHRVPDQVSDRAAALAEPLACVCHSLLDPSVLNAGDRVLVTGPGPMGLLAAQVAKTCGCAVVVKGVERDQERLAVARELGFTTTFEQPADGSYDVALECSGNAGGAATALAAVRRGGRYVGIGIFGRRIEVDLDQLLYKELIMSSGFASTPQSWRRALTLMGEGSLQLDRLVTRVAPLSDWRDVFDDMRKGRGLKVLFDPRLP